MPDYVVSRTVSALNDRSKSLRGSRILVLGLAYKPDIDDVRESPSFELIEKYSDLGAHVDYNDPLVAHTRRMRRHDLKMHSVPLSAGSLASYDAVVVSTNHSSYDWQLIADNSKLIIDSRNAMRRIKGKRDHIVSA
jgi:UDP-N-acetyl-D-glucosamine dehydrogenase